MSKDVIVLTPNGRRQKVHCKPDTNILQILEDVCQKQGLSPSEYALKHHNHTLDLSTTIRFSNLPNKATLEMVEAEKKRKESNVTIGLQLEDGERRTAEFTPNTILYDLVMKLAPGELNAINQPTILYMRQEVIGVPAMQTKTLRQLGLTQGRAILRLLNKAEEAKQANVSAIYRRPITTEEKATVPNADPPIHKPNTVQQPAPLPGPSLDINKHINTSFDPIKVIKEEKKGKPSCPSKDTKQESLKEEGNITKHFKGKEIPMEVDAESSNASNSLNKTTQEQLERRLRIEDEVTFVGDQKAVAFMQPDVPAEELVDLPDEFYELSLEEVRRLYHDLQQQRKDLENSPLIFNTKREEMQKQTSLQRMSQYKNAVVRIQFPDHIVLQGVFLPTNTIEDISNFVKQHLQNPHFAFHLFTTPLKESFDFNKTLLDAGFVPVVHMHFKWAQEGAGNQYLKKEIYSNTTSNEAANILASKYRAPTRKRSDVQAGSSQEQSTAGPSNASNLPKWVKW